MCMYDTLVTFPWSQAVITADELYLCNPTHREVQSIAEAVQQQVQLATPNTILKIYVLPLIYAVSRIFSCWSTRVSCSVVLATSYYIMKNSFSMAALLRIDCVMFTLLLLLCTTLLLFIRTLTAAHSTAWHSTVWAYCTRVLSYTSVFFTEVTAAGMLL
jgi:hypothetical protein